MRHLFYTLLCVVMCATSAFADNFTLTGNNQTTPDVAATTTSIDTVTIGSSATNLTITATQVTILLVDFAEIRDAEGGKKAVFLSQQGMLSYNGVMIKVDGVINNPLVRIYKAPGIFPPGSMRKYSDNEWFYYGDNGEYIVEYLDLGPNGWASEFITVNITGTGTNPTPTNPTPTNPTPNPPAGDYADIRAETARWVKQINDPKVANSLIKEYTTALAGLNGDLATMRNTVKLARRTAFQNTESTDPRWNTMLLAIDAMMITQEVDTPEEYKSAVTAYVNGIGDGLK